MKFLDLHGENHPAPYLHFLAKENKIDVRTIVEIGVWKGENAFMLRHLFPEAHLYLIDPWKPSGDYFLYGRPPSYVVGKYEHSYEVVKGIFKGDKKTTILRMTSEEGAKKVPDQIDLAYIDGDHSYDGVKQDIEIWRNKVRKGGLLCGHDFSFEFPDVIRAVEASLHEKYVVGKGTVWATIYH